MADTAKKSYVDAGWVELADGKPAVTELISQTAGGSSPWGDIRVPVPADELPYVHPHTVINR